MTPELRTHILALGTKVTQAEAAERAAVAALTAATANHQRAMEDVDAAIRAYDEAIETAPRRPGRPRKSADASQAAPPAPTPEPPPALPIAAPAPATDAERALTPGGDWLTDDDPAIRQWEVWLYTAAGYEDAATDAAGGLDPTVVFEAAKVNRAVPIGTPTTTINAVANVWGGIPAAKKSRALAIVREHGKDADRCVDSLRAMLAKGAA
jgi:hypothetical protein